MNIKTLDELLRLEDSVERQQRQKNINVNDMKLDYSEKQPPKIQRELLFGQQNIYVNKQRRYAATPKHTHTFVEMNYMYSGSCVQYINGQKIMLKTGDLLIIDRDAVQSIENTTASDILINILLKEETISTQLLANLASDNNLVSSFMVNAALKNGTHKNYLLFETSEQTALRQLLLNMLLVYFESYSHKTKTLNLYLSLVLIELTHMLEKQQHIAGYKSDESGIVTILGYIDQNYTTLTLKNLADHFGYNSVYMSNKLKKKLGVSFKDIVNRKRYLKAIELISETNLPLEEITQKIGYQQTSSLFKLLKKFTDKRPNELRNID